MAQHRPEVWVSDLYSSQKAHPARQWQVCLAHQLRDCQYAIGCGDDLFAPILKRMLLKAIGIGRRRKRLKESTLNQYVSRLKTKLWRALDLKPLNPEGQKLIRRYRRLQPNLFRFLEVEDVPPTNNSSERALRPSVIFRKVTNGFRSDWAGVNCSQGFALLSELLNGKAFPLLKPFLALLLHINMLGYSVKQLHPVNRDDPSQPLDQQK